MAAVVWVYEPDLFSSSRIESAGKRVGLEVNTITNANELRERLKDGLPNLMLVNLDLLDERDKSLAGLISAGSCRLIGYYSHVQAESAEKVLKRGFEVVIPRRAFVLKLSEIFSELGSGG
jgi:hypothetical protein